MLIDFSAKILDLQGKEMMNEEDKPITLAFLSCQALLASYPDEQNIPADQKLKRFRIAQAIVDGGAQDLVVEDVVLLKKALGRGLSTLAMGRAFDIIEPPKPALAGDVAKIEG